MVHDEVAERIDEGLAKAHALVEDFKEAWSVGHLVDAGGLQVKMLSWHNPARKFDSRELRFMLAGRLHVAQCSMDESEMAADYQTSPDILLLERVVDEATRHFRSLLIDAILEAASTGQLTP